MLSISAFLMVNMIEITGKDANNSYGINFVQIGDLYRNEGNDFSIVVYMKSDDGRTFVWAKVDTDAIGSRFLVFPVEPAVISEYLDGKISNAELSILSNSKEHFKYYIVDIDRNMEAIWLKVHSEDIPPQYANLFKETEFYTSSPDETAIREYLRTLQ